MRNLATIPVNSSYCERLGRVLKHLNTHFTAWLGQIQVLTEREIVVHVTGIIVKNGRMIYNGLVVRSLICPA